MESFTNGEWVARGRGRVGSVVGAEGSGAFARRGAGDCCRPRRGFPRGLRGAARMAGAGGTRTPAHAGVKVSGAASGRDPRPAAPPPRHRAAKFAPLAHPGVGGGAGKLAIGPCPPTPAASPGERSVGPGSRADRGTRWLLLLLPVQLPGSCPCPSPRCRLDFSSEGAVGGRGRGGDPWLGSLAGARQTWGPARWWWWQGAALPVSPPPPGRGGSCWEGELGGLPR